MKILDELDRLYPIGAYPGRSPDGIPPEWERDPYHVLVSTVLSQRTKDANTRAASDRLFDRFPEPSDLASAPLEEVKELIRPAGFPAQKAKAIVAIAKVVHNEWHDRLPADVDVLMTLPMVGRKTANCTLSYGFGLPAICVDTHVHRISNRIGLVDTRDPDDTETALGMITPRSRWCDINRLMVRFGQTLCQPRRPRCSECPIKGMCDHIATEMMQGRQ